MVTVCWISLFAVLFGSVEAEPITKDPASTLRSQSSAYLELAPEATLGPVVLAVIL